MIAWYVLPPPPPPTHTQITHTHPHTTPPPHSHPCYPFLLKPASCVSPPDLITLSCLCCRYEDDDEEHLTWPELSKWMNNAKKKLKGKGESMLVLQALPISTGQLFWTPKNHP